MIIMDSRQETARREAIIVVGRMNVARQVYLYGGIENVVKSTGRYGRLAIDNILCET